MTILSQDTESVINKMMDICHSMFLLKFLKEKNEVVLGFAVIIAIILALDKRTRNSYKDNCY